MAVCEWCKREMHTAKGCRVTTFIYRRGDVKRIPHGQETPIEGVTLPDRCHDCGVSKGGYHHHSCDMEECPTCHGQALSCECMREEAEALGTQGGSNLWSDGPTTVAHL